MTEPLRILAVEDQPANVALLQAVLRRATDPSIQAAELTLTGNLEEARNALRVVAFDAVILDLRLPDGNGLELAEELQASDPRPRILVLTANALPADELAARAAGADAFLAKPYDPTVLLEVLGGMAAAIREGNPASD